jgi:N-acetylneuraminic acid mutarotase
MPSPVQYTAGSVVDGKLYVLGGGNYQVSGSVSPLATVEVYDPAIDKWASDTSMPTARQNLGAATVNGMLYAFGGRDQAYDTYATNEAFTPAPSAIKSTTTGVSSTFNPSAFGQSVTFTATVTGTGPATPTGSVTFVDTTTNTTLGTASIGSSPTMWSGVASMATGRSSPGAVTGPDGRIYVIGGYNHGIAQSANEAFDTTTNTWTTVASLPTARYNFAIATAPNGRIYAIGGQSDNVGMLNTVEAYDPSTNTWSAGASMPTARNSPGAAVGPDGRIYVIGGWNNGSLNTVEAYDPTTNTWATVASMPTARQNLAVVTGPDGRIYAIDGYNGSELNTVEVYDTTTDTWATVASAPTARHNVAAAVGPDGRINALGGYNGTFLNTVEAYDPAANTWTAAPGLSAIRNAAGAATGPDGRIYAVGGENGSSYLNTAEALSFVAITPSVTTNSLAVGNHVIIATYSGDNRFRGSSGTVTQTVNPAGSTVTVAWTDGSSVTYDAHAHGAMASWASTGTDGGGGPLTVSYVGIDGTSYGPSPTAPPNAGQYEASASFTGDANHTASSGNADFTIGKADAVVHITPYSGTYDAQAHGISGYVTGVAGEPANLTADLNLGVQFTNVPGGTANWSFTGSGNYTEQSGTAAVAIGAAPLTITPADATRVYGAPNPSFSGTNVGLQDGDAITASYSTTADGNSPVGTYDVTAVLSDPDNKLGNYLVTLDVGHLSVTPAATATTAAVSASTVLFGLDSVTVSTTIAVVAPGSGSPTGLVAFYDGTTFLGTGSVSGGTVALPLSSTALAVGPHTIRAAYSGDGNFLASSCTTSLTVNPPSSLSGIVWEDFNNDGQVDFGESGISGVTISLTGTDNLGSSVNRSQTTDSDGAYIFLNLRPGTYYITETQPAGYLQGIDTAGTAGGGLAATDQFLIPLGPGVNGMNYNFGEQPTATGSVQKGQTATIGFWNNKNGQALINAFNGGTGTELADWFAATLPHIFGVSAGSNNLTHKSNACVATLFQQDFLVKGVKLDAQVLATALSVYATNATLDSTGVAAKYGFTVSGDGVGTATANVGNDGDAFGVANNTTMTVMDLLLATDAQSVNGVLYGGNTTKRTEANDIYSLINQAGGI